MVCLGNVHMVMTSYDEQSFAEVMEEADFVTHDGMPLVWAMRLLGHSGLERVYGPHLMSFLCHSAASHGIPIGLYGGSPAVLADLCHHLEKKHPGLRIVYRMSPPFRELSKEENDRDLRLLRDSGARLLFVGIGCPKQELWMSANKKRFQGPMLGVGQAFDIHSGHSRMAPRWLQNLGMEWAYRLCTEPRRLWKRYLKNNHRYIILIIMQLFARRFSSELGRRGILNRYIASVITPHLRESIRGGISKKHRQRGKV